jgi:hypothetical protein
MHLRRLRRPSKRRARVSACTTRRAPRTSSPRPGANGIENTQVRLTDGSVIFTPDLFGPGITVDKVDYQMASVDGGVKYKGFALEAELYWRWLSDFGARTPRESTTSTITATRCKPPPWRSQDAAALRRRVRDLRRVRRRVGGAGGLNWYFVKERGLRFHAEWIHLKKCPSATPPSLSRGRQRRPLPRERRDDFLMRTRHRGRRSLALRGLALAAARRTRRTSSTTRTSI